MKLIDADALPKAMEYDYETDEMKILYYDAWAIAHAPTVDAIPIERLEQEIDRYIDLGLNSVAKELRTILDDWRKENESNIND